MNECRVIAVTNQKGGVAKTTTTFCMGVGLVRKGYRVLMIDLDPQQSLTYSFGVKDTDELEYTIADLLQAIMDGNAEPDYERATMLHPEGVKLIPANYAMCAIDLKLQYALSRETVAKRIIDALRPDYDFILIDCMPSLGMLTVNAWTAADSVVVPVTPDMLSAKGLDLLLQSIIQVRRQLNPHLEISGILLTIVEDYTKDALEVMNALRESADGNIHVYEAYIPKSVKLKQCIRFGRSIFAKFKNSRAARAYEGFVSEFLGNDFVPPVPANGTHVPASRSEELARGEKLLMKFSKDEMISFIARKSRLSEYDLISKTKSEILSAAKENMEHYEEEVIRVGREF